MTQADARAQHHFVAGLVGGLADLGLRHVWITPGSRSTPLTLGFAGRPEVRSHVHLDERSAAFSALGMATVTDRPVALVCTSGTAAAEYLPAVVEARYGRVPLLLFTADRPPELRHTGAHQTIDQVRLFGGHARWFHDPGPIDVTAGAAEAGAVLASRVWEEAAGTPPGPVHVNLPFREPLLPSSAIPVPAPGKHDRREAARPRPDPGALDDVAARLSGRRVLIVCGPQRDDALPGAVAALASALDAPVLADALSGLRRGGHGHDHVVSAGHALGGAGWLDRHPPEVILRLGAIPTSKPVFTWLDRTDRLQILVDAGAPRDAGTGPRLNVAADPATVIAGLAALAPPGSTGWTARWLEADRAATAAQRSAIAAESFPNEPGIVAALDEALPSGATLWTASSMPVRDVDAYLSAGPRPLRLLANRGANGIDGFTSAALGGALAGDEPTYALAGDLSIVHDLSGLAAAGRTGAPVTIVAADNDGGGIFHFLPQADAVAGFERLFATPHGLDLVAAAQGLGVPAQRVADRGVLESLVSVRPDGPRLVVVPTDRTTNVAVHRRIQTAVTAAVSELG